MFPDLTADDVFRIETKRLWLRWPKASDAESISAFVSLAQVADMTAGIPHPYPAGEAERFVFRARAQNANGSALILAMAPKPAGRTAAGLISAAAADADEAQLGYVVAPAAWGKGFGTEAVKALADLIFTITRAKRITANARLDNAASCRVLEKAGFAVLSRGPEFLPARGKFHNCNRFALDRESWAATRAGQARPDLRLRRNRAAAPALTARGDVPVQNVES